MVVEKDVLERGMGDFFEEVNDGNKRGAARARTRVRICRSRIFIIDSVLTKWNRRY